MNWKERIKNLRLPRLLIEAVLIFGSVYMALVLEANRSRDFEREILVNQLNRVLSSLHEDSLKVSRLNYSEGTNVIELVSKNLEGTLLPYLKMDSIIIRYYDFGEDQDLEASIHFILSVPMPEAFYGQYLKTPKILYTVEEDYGHTVLNSGTLISLEKFTEFRSILWEMDQYSVEYQETLFNYFLDKEDFGFPVLSKEIAKRVLNTQVFENIIRADHTRKIVILNYAGNILSSYPDIKKTLRAEIHSQKEAMKGIF